jgi:hypothetical protein
MGTDHDSSMKDKSDMELEELVRDNPRSTQLHKEAQSERDLREQKRLRRPALTKAFVGAVLLVTAIIAYMRTC